MLKYALNILEAQWVQRLLIADLAQCFFIRGEGVLPTSVLLFNCRDWMIEACLLEKNYCKFPFGSPPSAECVYCEAMKTAPEKRSGAMRAVILSEELQLEAGKELLSTRARTQPEEVERLHHLKLQETSSEAILLTKASLHTSTMFRRPAKPVAFVQAFEASDWNGVVLLYSVVQSSAF